MLNDELEARISFIIHHFRKRSVVVRLAPMPTTPSHSTGTTRRDFLKTVAAVTAVAAMGIEDKKAAAQTAPAAQGAIPWYQRAMRWGQTNITEADIAHYDIAWWRKYWKRTRVQGVIINAGGIFAYYPSKFPLHYRPPQLKDRDLYGELAAAAHADGLCVLARMDSSKGHEDLYQAHPDWFGVDASGQVYRSGEFYLSCISGGYYSEFLPGVLREIIERTHPEGLTDNIWSGLDRNMICYCKNCVDKFKDYSGSPLPARRDWNDPIFRKWTDWNYDLRIKQWEFNNKVTQEAGGADCVWVGMNGAGTGGQSGSFRDLKEICARAPILLLDNQSRSSPTGFQENAMSGKFARSLLGPDKIIIESMAMYQHGAPQFRFSAKTAPEARMWMAAGFAGGIGPWWHHVGAYHEDRRAYKTAEPMMRWHEANQEYLINRTPMVSVAVGWSQRNADFFGRDNAGELVDEPMRGFTQAMIRARIGFVPLHLDDLEKAGADITTLVLPNVGGLSDSQVTSIRQFVKKGGSLVASGQTGLFNEFGDARSDFALADLFGVKGGKGVMPTGPRVGRGGAAITDAAHTYLRLTPELRGTVDGPMWGDEPAASGTRHEILAGFEETDVLPYGGSLQTLSPDGKAQVLLTFVPAFPATPPEVSWMRVPKTDVPGLVINENAGGRVAYLAADIDRRYAMYNFPDHGDLLANIVRWAAKDDLPLKVDSPGLVHCELYRQNNRLILHVVNLTSSATWKSPVDQLTGIGPIGISIKLPSGISGGRCSTLVGDSPKVIAGAVANGWVKLTLPSVVDHQVLVVEG